MFSFISKSSNNLWAFALLGIFLSVSISSAYVVAVILLVDWIWRLAIQKEKGLEFKGPLDYLILTAFIWGILTTAFNQSTYFGKSISAQSAILFYFLFSRTVNRDQSGSVIKWYCVSSAVMALWGIVQYFSGFQWHTLELKMIVPSYGTNVPEWLAEALSSYGGRAVGSRSHPLTYAESLVPAFFMLGHMIRLNRKNIPALIGFLLVGGGILASMSRGVWLSILIGVIVYTFFLPKKERLVFGLTLVGGVVFLLAVSPQIRQRAFSIFKFDYVLYRSDVVSNQVRLSVWKTSLTEIQKKPIVGYGIKGVKFEVPGASDHVKRMWSEGHNIFLQAALERGIIGLILILLIIYFIAVRFRKIPPEWRGLVFGCGVSFLMMGITESWLKDKEVAFIFWVFIGISSSLIKLHTSKP